jgi:hypothetical protein
MEWRGYLSEFLLAACGTDCLLNRSFDTNHLACAVMLRVEGSSQIRAIVFLCSPKGHFTQMRAREVLFIFSS